MRMIIAASATLFATAAFAFGPTGPYDVNGDNRLDRTEFAAIEDTLRAEFETVDLNDDGVISESEFNAAAFVAVDIENDDSLSADERVDFRDLTRNFAL